MFFSSKVIRKSLFSIQRRIHYIQIRDLLCLILKFFLPRQTINQGNNYLNLTESEHNYTNALKNDGFADLAIALDAEKIGSIRNKLDKLKCYDVYKKDVPEVDVKYPDKDVQLAQYLRDDLVEIDEILSIANDSRILNIVSNYLGVKPTISNINCWWSFANRDTAKEAQLYHRDVDDFKFVKMFFYLTDVSDEAGPHIYVKKSHKSNKLIQLRRFTNEEVESTFQKENLLILTRPKGNGFIEDTYGIHKGQLPSSENRLILQIQYSFLPLYVENYNPKCEIKINSKIYDKYINRLLFTN